jgi:hypothetical protein
LYNQSGKLVRGTLRLLARSRSTLRHIIPAERISASRDSWIALAIFINYFSRVAALAVTSGPGGEPCRLVPAGDLASLRR